MSDNITTAVHEIAVRATSAWRLTLSESAPIGAVQQSLRVGIGLENDEFDGDVVGVPKVQVMPPLATAQVRLDIRGGEVRLPLLEFPYVSDRQADVIKPGAPFGKRLVDRIHVLGEDKSREPGGADEKGAVAIGRIDQP
jgi:hypothetical protein